MVSKGLFASILKYTSVSHKKDSFNRNLGAGKVRGAQIPQTLHDTTRNCSETTLLAAPSLKGLDSCQITLKERLSLSVRLVKKINNPFIVVGT